MNKEWKFEPDPFTKGYINYLDKSPIKFDALKNQLIYLEQGEKERNLTDNEKVVK